MFSWFKKKKPAADPAYSTHNLTDIARGMQHAVNSAQEVAELHYARMLDRWFHDDGSPKVEEFKLPGNLSMFVPTITLVPMDGLLLEKMRVRMAVRVDEAKIKAADETGAPHEMTRTSFQISFAPRTAEGKEASSNVIDIMMEFKRGDEPEAVARIVEQYTNLIRPMPGGENPYPAPPPHPKGPHTPAPPAAAVKPPDTAPPAAEGPLKPPGQVD